MTRVGMDVAERFPTLLVSYKVVGSRVSLHGWNGSNWVNIDPANYRAGDFFRKGPDSALIIEEANSPLPEGLVPPEAWCDSVYRITTTEPRPVIHLVGQYFDFRFKDWATFSENYQLPIDAINPVGLNISWYHRSLGEHLKKSGKSVEDDLRYWVAERHPVPVVEKPSFDPVETNALDAAESEEPAESDETPAMELPSDPVVIGNPLTNEAPAAVVYGAGEAEASIAE